MFRKTISFLLLLALILPTVLSAGTAGAEAANAPEQITSGDFIYTVLNDGTAEIVDYTGKDAGLRIPGAIDGLAVTRIGTYAFSQKKITSVSIPDSVTGFGDYAFFSCEGLTSVSIPAGVTDVGRNPFLSCKSLSEIIVSPGNPVLKVVEGVLFSSTDNSLVCYPIAKPDKVYEIPQGTEIIGDSAFADCSGLASVSVPESAAVIVSNPFTCCDSLSDIRVAQDNPAFAAADGVLFSRADNRIICYPCGKKDTAYDIPQGTQVIGEDAFKSCANLKSISLPESITTIDDYAFESCKGLTAIDLPSGVTDIGKGVFRYCSGLTSLTIPEGVTVIGEYFCLLCRSLKTVILPETVTAIEDFAFNSCMNLKSINIPDSVTSIGNNAFFSCKKLVITCSPGSYARAYAEKNRIRFADVSAAPAP